MQQQTNNNMFTTTFYSAVVEIQQITDIINSMGHRINSGNSLSDDEIKEDQLQQANRIALLKLQSILIQNYTESQQEKSN